MNFLTLVRIGPYRLFDLRTDCLVRDLSWYQLRNCEPRFERGRGPSVAEKVMIKDHTGMRSGMKSFNGEPISLADLRFFFVFGPNNSGTTVLSQYVSEQLGGYLPPFGNNEGQMIPAVRQMMRLRPWDRNRTFDWEWIRTIWEKKSKGRIFVEGSPPNMIRIDDISRIFGGDSTAILLISDPYQQIASSMRRYKSPGFNPTGLVDQWVSKAYMIKEIGDKYPQFPLIKYEEFTRKPQIVNDLIGVPKILSRVQGKKGSEGNRIKNMRATTTLFLTKLEIDAISERLENKKEILDSFGYTARSGDDLIQELSRDVEAADKAQKRRAEWMSATRFDASEPKTPK